MTKVSSKDMQRSIRVIHILFGVSLTIVSIFAIGLLYLEALSPAQLFINDTTVEVNEYLIGGTSPGVSLHIAPGASQLVDMPSWWGTPSFPRTEKGTRVQPRWNFGIFMIYYLSDFPETW